MAALLPADDLSRLLRAETLPAGLRMRQIRPCRGSYCGHLHLVLVTSGRIALELPEASHEITAPAALILPPLPEALLKLDAGSEGFLFGLAPQLLGEVLGLDAEMERMLPQGGGLLLCTDLTSEAPPDPEALARAILLEAAQPRTGSRTSILSCLRLLIVQLWRNAHQHLHTPAAGSDSQLIEAFRREVEVHFRNHLPVSGYAARLGVSEARLRRVCLKGQGKTPLQLIHRRIMREALAWLEHSARPVAEIAQSLGFSDAAEFSHFFKRSSGQSPSHYRASLSSRGPRPDPETDSFADWP
ncbi:AraC family transcriptional regulator [Falsigemmobacter intermedius]|uniref:helix-turn-helix transcriptional regulator n=1 Tax=Falsigemmobacter intermedius TaxID=1553448 RepID=UPI003F0B9F01